MEVIRSQVRSRPGSRALAIARLIGVLYVVTGLGVAWLTLTTPFVDAITAHGPTASSQNAYHAVGLVTALVIPAMCLLLGTNRILEFADVRNPLGARRDPLASLGSHLGADYAVVRNLSLPGGRHVGALIVGPPGIVVVGALPRPGDARPVDGRARVRALSAPRGTAQPEGGNDVRRRAADVRDRPCADGAPDAPHAR